MRRGAGHHRLVGRSDSGRLRAGGIGGRQLGQWRRGAGGHPKREHGWNQEFHGNDPNGIDVNATERASRPGGGELLVFAQVRCLELSSRLRAHDRTRACGANAVSRVWEDVPNGRRNAPRANRSARREAATLPRVRPRRRWRGQSSRHDMQSCSSLQNALPVCRTGKSFRHARPTQSPPAGRTSSPHRRDEMAAVTRPSATAPARHDRREPMRPLL